MLVELISSLGFRLYALSSAEARNGVCSGEWIAMSKPHVTVSPPCQRCGSPDVSAMSVTPEAIFWWCALCGSIWGVPTHPMPVTFEPDVERLRAGLQGDAARLGHIAPELEHIAASVLIADDTGRYVAVNKKACELTGYSRALNCFTRRLSI